MLLLIHAEDDDLVPTGQSHSFARLVTKHDKSHKFIVLQRTGRDMPRADARTTVLENLEELLRPVRER